MIYYLQAHKEPTTEYGVKFFILAASSYEDIEYLQKMLDDEDILFSKEIEEKEAIAVEEDNLYLFNNRYRYELINSTVNFN